MLCQEITKRGVERGRICTTIDLLIVELPTARTSKIKEELKLYATGGISIPHKNAALIFILSFP